jgi:hypothetical protein
MTLREKLQVIESGWRDVRRRSESFESPEWHREILAECERRVAAGEARFIDWEQAKVNIRKRVSSRHG